MSIQPIGSESGVKTASIPQKPQGAQEFTTVTTHCSKQHKHDKSCPHTESTQKAPRMGEPGYLLDVK